MSTAARAAAIAVAAYCGLVGLFLAANDGNPEWFIHFGDPDSTIIEHGRAVLGDDVMVPHTQGQDGQTFWLMARDPLLADRDVVETYVDRPAYRYQRVGYPALAAPFRLVGEDALVWGLVIVNLIAVGAGTWWTVRLAEHLGAPPRAAAWFALNPAVAAGVLLDGSDAWAVALTVGGVWGWMTGRVPTAAVCFAGAALTKEVSLLAPAALAAADVLGRRRWKRPLQMALPAAVATMAWAAYVRWRLDFPPSQIEELAAPLTGFRDAWRRTWEPFGDWGHAATAVGLGALMVAVVWLAWRWRDRPAGQVALAAAPFAVLYLLLSAQVLGLAVNAVRAAGPVPTLAALAVYARAQP